MSFNYICKVYFYTIFYFVYNCLLKYFLNIIISDELQFILLIFIIKIFQMYQKNIFYLKNINIRIFHYVLDIIINLIV